MLTYPSFNPVAFHLGSWPVYWYGLMYLVGFLGGWGVLSLRLRHSSRGFTQEQLSDIVFYAALGAILGGRFGYILFYETQTLWSNPFRILQVWIGGMSFHGGLLGVVIALAIFAKKINKPFLALADLIAPAVPIGLGAGRIGNFINGELWGRVTDVPWAMMFPRADNNFRHPSQLYEFLLEGVLLFFILWIFSKKPRPTGAVCGLFTMLYGVFRCFVEFFREPDVGIGYYAEQFTQGQLLSIPLILVGIGLLVYAYRCPVEKLT